MKPDRNPVAAHQIHLAPVLGLCVSERVERGVRNHPEPSWIRISNYFCLGTYVPSTHTLRSFLQVPRICLKICRAPAWSERDAAVTTTISNKPRVSTNTWRLRPLTFLPLSNPLSAPPTSVVFTD